MSRFRLLLLDANVVIYLFQLGLWDRVVECCDVHLAETVVEESDFYDSVDGVRHRIDLTEYIRSRAISVFEVPVERVQAFCDEFSSCYKVDIDPGEAESLAHLLDSGESYKICSADHIVFQVLGSRYRSGQGISLEEVLQDVGLSRPLRYIFTKAYRQKRARDGFSDGFSGLSEQ